MAIYHFTAKAITRGNGQSAVAKAAYNARERLRDKRAGETRDYRKKGGLIFSGIYLPEDAPEWAKDRANLWNAVEDAEKLKNSKLATEYEIALPCELSEEHRRYLVQDFVRDCFIRKGYAVDVNIHAPDSEGDQRNHHAHLLVTDRRLLPSGFAPDKKERHKNTQERREELINLRIAWEKIGNRHLQRRGFQPTLDHRSFKERNLKQTPSTHQGVAITAMRRRGVLEQPNHSQPDEPQAAPTKSRRAYPRVD